MQNETTLSEGEETLRAILNTVVDGIITIDERGCVQAMNPAAETIFGYAANEVIGKNVKMLMPSPYHEEHDGYLSNYLRTGERKIIGSGREVEGRRKDGSTFPMELAVSEVQGRSRIFTGIVRDVTDRKRADERATGVGHIIEDSLNEIYIFGATTMKFIQVNRGGRENLGYSMEELQEMTPLSFKPEYTFESFTELVEPLRTHKERIIQFDTVHRRKDGSLYNVDVHLQLTTLEGSPCFVAIILDITEKKRIERELLEFNEHLEELVETRTRELKEAQEQLVRKERLATLGLVSGGIAHEIRNPLNAVKTSAYYLVNAKNATPEKIAEHLERIDRQVTIIDNVVTALSDVARLPDPELNPTELTPLVKAAIRGVNLPANVEVTIEIPDEIPDVLVDGNQIPIVFKNLVRNAREAMPDGGQLHVSAEATDHQVCIAFKDTGIGIAPEDLERIMEPLFSTKARGMGLGLAITRSIVEKNKGELTVISQQGHGSTFTVKLGPADGA